ncbi:dickkopf-related protein 2 isoform X1 [Tyto alba]|uniref:dickkopf-related protein 2 isoform X1 n=1 Tax=Tyto alba TaxID=56313 RepID=UPI0014024D39|nr:dickkopf-related protein 2 isoform X1 [Tyto alba]XP_032853752.1 dickkopf-related protein 2 isoform X1 [Tyto alba]
MCILTGRLNPRGGQVRREAGWMETLFPARAAVLIVESSQLDSSSSKVNSIKSTLMGEAPTQATNRSAGIHQGLTLASSKKGKMLEQMGKPPKHYHRQGEAYPCTNDKECEVGRYCHSPHQATSACMMCRRKKKRCHRDGMCCPGNRCNNGICIPVTESILTPHIPALEGPRNKKNSHYASKDLGWQNLGRPRSKLSHIKGHEGDPCLRSSDCIEGHCCARHFWTKICKPVLHQGEVCTKQRKKGSHGLEIFQRCDCAKGLSCKVWKDATSSSKSRLHVCQKI